MIASAAPFTAVDQRRKSWSLPVDNVRELACPARGGATIAAERCVQDVGCPLAGRECQLRAGAAQAVVEARTEGPGGRNPKPTHPPRPCAWCKHLFVPSDHRADGNEPKCCSLRCGAQRRAKAARDRRAQEREP